MSSVSVLPFGFLDLELKMTYLSDRVRIANEN